MAEALLAGTTRVTIDPASPLPPYEQLRARVVEVVRSGELAPGDRLPPVRALAAELGLAANTVARAYRELETDEVIETRGRNGSVISTTGDPAERKTQEAALSYAAMVKKLGVEPQDALRAVRRALGITD